MSKDPKDDQQLARFLRSHAQRAPVVPADLEERIMRACHQPDAREMSAPWIRFGGRHIILSAITAGLLAYVVTKQITKAPTPASTTELEEFIETSWDSTFADEGGSEFRYSIVGLDEF